jgi:hypothetical protein
MEWLLAVDRKKVRDNHIRIAKLYEQQDPDLFIINSRDRSLDYHAHATA